MAVDARSDEELLDAWRAGDVRAGTQLYDRHVAAVARFFRNKLPEQVDEFIQRTFLALVESHERIRAQTSFRALLLGIARHELLDHLRESRRETVEFERESISDFGLGPSTIVTRKREQRLLLEALRRIPIEHQIALELSYWEGMNAAEIAKLFEISHSAMRSRMSKARSMLEDALHELAESRELLESTKGSLDAWAADIRAKI